MKVNLTLFPTAIQTIGTADTWLFVRFGELQQAIELVEQLIQESRTNLEAEFKMADSLPEEERFWLRKHTEYQVWWIRDRFPHVLRQALFLSCYAEIESYLNRLCRTAQKEQGLGLSVDDSAGRGIKRAKDYLTKVAGIDFPAQSTEWQALTNYGALRNVLAHTEGQAHQIGKGIQTYVRSHRRLHLDEKGRIFIRQGFCEEVIGTALALFWQLPLDLREAASCDWYDAVPYSPLGVE